MRPSSTDRLEAGQWEAEVHRYRGRFFVTAGWGSRWGVALSDVRDLGELGAAVTEALRRSWRPDFDDRGSVEDREDSERWARFCRDVVGVPPERYRPEIRIDMYRRVDTSGISDGLLHVRPLFPDATADKDAEETLPADSDPATIAEVVSRLLRDTQPGPIPGEWRAGMVQRVASVALREGELIVTSSSPTPNGWMMNDYLQMLDADAADGALGAALVEALERSVDADRIAWAKVEASLPPTLQRQSPALRKLYRALGIRSWRAYAEGTKQVDVVDDDAEPGPVVTPMKNAGREGFTYLTEAAEQLPRETSAAELARAVRRAFERSV